MPSAWGNVMCEYERVAFSDLVKQFAVSSRIDQYKDFLREKLVEFQKDPEAFKAKHTQSELETMGMDCRTLKLA
jgi:hypothetical protein